MPFGPRQRWLFACRDFEMRVRGIHAATVIWLASAPERLGRPELEAELSAGVG